MKQKQITKMNNKKYGMPPPMNRTEMEHNLNLVIEDFNNRIDSGNEDSIQNAMWATYPHLKEVKKTPNFRINLLTVNERIRLHANMQRWMK